MGLALLVIGVLLAGVGIRGTQGKLAALLAGDFSGAGSFWFWIAGLFFAGSIGYYPPIRAASRLLIILILLVLLLSNQGFWAQLVAQLKAPTPSAAPGPETPVEPTSAQAITKSVLNTTAPGADMGGKMADAVGIPKATGQAAGIAVGTAAAGVFNPLLGLEIMSNLLNGSHGK